MCGLNTLTLLSHGWLWVLSWKLLLGMVEFHCYSTVSVSTTWFLSWTLSYTVMCTDCRQDCWLSCVWVPMLAVSNGHPGISWALCISTTVSRFTCTTFCIDHVPKSPMPRLPPLFCHLGVELENKARPTQRERLLLLHGGLWSWSMLDHRWFHNSGTPTYSTSSVL